MINYCNEKLHQVFIELTLQSEQEEYIREVGQFKSDRPKISPRGVQNEKIENPQTLPGCRSG